MCRDKAEPIVGVDLGGHGRDLPQGWGRRWVEGFLPDALHVGGDAVGAVGVDAAEVCSDKAFGHYSGMVWGCVVADEDLSDEGLEVGGLDIVHLLLRLGRLGHGGWICFSAGQFTSVFYFGRELMFGGLQDQDHTGWDVLSLYCGENWGEADVTRRLRSTSGSRTFGEKRQPGWGSATQSCQF